MLLQRLLCCGLLGGLLASCGSTRSTHPASTEDLAEFVLILRELPDGQITHSWQHARWFWWEASS